MDSRAWLGLVLLVVTLGISYFGVRAKRRAGITQSFGHPVLDQVLLLISGLVLAAVMAAILFLLRGRSRPIGSPHPIEERLVGYPLLILVGLMLVTLCNRILRRTGKRK